MSTPKFVQAKKTTLASGVSATEATSIVLSSLLDIYGNQLAMSDFAGILYLTIGPGGTDEEIISCTNFTVNADGTVTLSAGILRAYTAKYPYTAAGGTANSHAAGTTVVISDQPQMYQAILSYIDGIAIAGAPNASTIVQGLLQVATAAQINAGTALGSTGAPLAVTPDQLVLSSLFLNTPSTSGAQFVSATTGMCIPFIGTSVPTGFLAVDGTAYANDTYPSLLAIAKASFGYGTGVTFTGNAATDVITATAHGLIAGARLLLNSTSALPAGLLANTVYYVITVTTNTFQLSTTLGGSAVNFTDSGTGTHSYYTTFKLPDARGRGFIGSGTGTRVATFVSRASNVITVTNVTNAANNGWQTGQAVLYSAPSGAMTGLTDNTTYYLIRLSNTTFSLATTLALAQAGTPIALSSDGTGTQTFTITLPARTVGDYGGEENHAISLLEIAPHTHGVPSRLGSTTGANAADPGASSSANSTFATDTGSGLGNNAMNNMSPFFTGTWIVKT